jgi:hypothetical protein
MTMFTAHFLKRSLIGALAFLFLASGAASAQQKTKKKGAPQKSALEAASQDTSQKIDVEGALKEEEETLAGRSYSYDPSGRRDPFRSLLSREPQKPGERPPGVAGLTVDEIELQGIWKIHSGYIAQVRGSDNKSYLLRKGDQLFDGEVTSVGPNEIDLRQNINDPQSVKPFREVVKPLSVPKPQ